MCVGGEHLILLWKWKSFQLILIKYDFIRVSTILSYKLISFIIILSRRGNETQLMPMSVTNDMDKWNMYMNL